MKRYLSALLAVFIIIGLSACESRTSSSSSQAASTSPAVSEAAPVPSAEIPPPPSSSEPSSAPERPTITDPGQIIAAKEIVVAMFERAAVADELYRAAIKRDGSMDPQILEDKEYFPVIDDRFFTVNDVRDWWMHTFTTGGSASNRFEAMQKDAVYRSMNGELYVLSEQRQKPLTMGKWNIDSFELLLFDALELEVRMETSLLGAPEGKKILRIVKNGDSWLLGDSYFLD